MLDNTQLVRLAVAEMQRQKMTSILADHLPQFSQPTPIVGYIPDATALYRGSLIVLEAEPTDGLASAHTDAQLLAFYNYASKYSGSFVLAVETANASAAKALLHRLLGDVQNAILWTF